MTVIQGKDRMEHFALMQAYYRLRLEIESGLVFKQSTLAALKRRFPERITARTKAKALVQYEELLKEMYPGWEPKQRS